MSQSQSCLVTKLQNYIDIDQELASLLANLESNEEHYVENEEVNQGIEKADSLYVVKEGCFINYSLLPDGGRMVSNVYHPGDIIGFDEIAFEGQPEDLKCCTEGCLSPFDKATLDEVFKEAPKLTALLFSLSVCDQAIIADRFRAATRMKAQDRVTHFLLEVVHKLRVANTDITDEFKLPLTQSEIGDTVGLTNVSVSRAFTQLEEDGQITRDLDRVKILKEDEMIQMACFEDRLSKVNTAWFPSY